MEGWKEGNVRSSHYLLDILPRRPGPKLAPVSGRLKATLIHPNKDSFLVGLRYSPDGRRIIAGDYPGGVVQTWDVQTGRQLARIDTGYGYRGYDYFCVTPDWKTIYASRRKSSLTRLEKDGKIRTLWRFDGSVLSWDLKTGQLQERISHAPRDVSGMQLSPDGATYLTDEEFIDEKGDRAYGMNLFTFKTKTHRRLPARLRGGLYSPDGKSLALVESHDGDSTGSVRLFDVRSLKQTLSINIAGKFTQPGVAEFSPDGKKLAGHVRSYSSKEGGRPFHDTLKVWDAQLGTELISLPAPEKNTIMYTAVFSPTGAVLAVTNRDLGVLYLFEMANHKLLKRVALAQRPQKGERILVRKPAFSADGRWLTLVTQILPENDREPLAEDIAQPRIHLVDVATGEIRETLIGPQAFTDTPCFSPDGTSLASGGLGRVLIWDITAK